jgi:hypothetical protein
MARPVKQGLEYFSFDVDFFNDEKVEFVSARFGIKGELISIRLLCKIYRIGYYTEWNEDESTLLAKRAGDSITPSLVSDVVNELVKRGFFDESIFNRFSILTSKGIQKRYVKAVGERKGIEINTDYWLIDTPKNACFEVNRDEKRVNPPNNPVNRSINPQSKVKESKVNNNPLTPLGGDAIDPLLEVYKLFHKAYEGRKDGLETTFNQYRRKYKDWRAIIPLLMPALANEISWRKQAEEAGVFVPSWANLSTWLNQRRWEQEHNFSFKNNQHEPEKQRYIIK